MLRYRTGDVTRLVARPCRCGRHVPADGAHLGAHRRHARDPRRQRLPERDRGGGARRPRDLARHYAIVVDRRAALPELEVHAELREPGGAEAVAERLRARLERKLRLRVAVTVGEPGSLPRQEVGKAQRVFERSGD